MDAITDIAVVLPEQGERVPEEEGFEALLTTAGGEANKIGRASCRERV